MENNKAQAIASAVRQVERLTDNEQEQQYLFNMLVGLNVELMEKATFYNHAAKRGYEWGN